MESLPISHLSGYSLYRSILATKFVDSQASSTKGLIIKMTNNILQSKTSPEAQNRFHFPHLLSSWSIPQLWNSCGFGAKNLWRGIVM